MIVSVVSWNWGAGQPGGTVAETKKEGEIAITSKRGNKIKKNAEPSDPAVHVERSGNDVVKRASELNVEEKANGDDSGDKKEDETKEPEPEATNGEKRKLDDVEKEEDKVEDKKEEEEKKDEPLVENDEGKTVKAKEPPAKKQKKEPAKGKKGAASAKPDEEDKKEEEKADGVKAPEKKKAGRPKKGDGAPSKQKKEPTPRSTDGIGSRTRSRQTA